MRLVFAIAAAALVAQAARTVWDGAYSAAQATRGAAVYTERCESCHGQDLGGIGQAAPLIGDDFRMEWNDQSLNDLFERTRVSMPADKPGSLERQQVADVIAFLLQKNGFPTGSSDVPTAADALGAVKILAKKP